MLCNRSTLTAGVSRAFDVESEILGSGDEGLASKLRHYLGEEDDWFSVNAPKRNAMVDPISLTRRQNGLQMKRFEV